MLALPGPPPAEGHAHPAVELFVRHGRGAGAAVQTVAMCGRGAVDTLPGIRNHARPLHPRIRAGIGEDGAEFTDAVEHIRWRLWHGQTGRALRLIQRTLTAVKAKADGKTAAARSAAKLMKALIVLETYVSGLADLIIDYASARLGDEPFSTSPTEGAVQWLLHRRMGAQLGAAANAVVAAWCSLYAPGPDGHRQRHVRCGSPRHLPASPLISHGSMIAPMFGTVSCVPKGRFVSSGLAGDAVSAKPGRANFS